MKYVVEAIGLPFHTIQRTEVEGAIQAMAEYRKCLALPGTEYVTVAIAILHRRNARGIGASVEPLQYGYNGLGQVAHWRQVKWFASPQFKRAHPQMYACRQ